MANLKTENLTERMERIRLKNEEIEKKHREAMEDRLAAVKNNAMVAIKPPSDDDWPRKHKYDTLDFTYDATEPQNVDKARPGQVTQALRPGKEHKKFADGQGPPPDPVYNFLADAERDGTPQQTTPPRSGNQDGGAGKGAAWKQSSGYRNRNGTAGGSFRQNRGKPREQRYPFERQKSSGDAKWKGSPQQRPTNAPPKASPNTAGELVTEKRGNITISVSQDGEIKSVKLASPPAVPGSGRIGIRSVNMAKGASHFTNSSPLHKNSSSHQHFHSQPHHHHHLDHHQTIKSSGVQSRLERNRQMAAETITAEN